MPWWIRLGAFAIALALGVIVLVNWREARQQQAALQTELKTTQQALAEATARESSRDTSLNTLLAQLKQLKGRVQKPEQVIAALPQVLPLPQAITLSQGNTQTAARAPTSPQRSGEAEGGPYNGKPANSVTADFPAVDLKPLYDFALDCKSCQAQLSAAQADLKDEKAKEQELSRERDDALRAAKGGSVLRRVARAAKWFVIGAAAGAIAVKAVR